MMKFRIMRLHLGLHRLPYYPFGGGVNGLKMVKAGFCANAISLIISFGDQFTFLSYKHSALVLFKVNIWQLHIKPRLLQRRRRFFKHLDIILQCINCIYQTGA